MDATGDRRTMFGPNRLSSGFRILRHESALNSDERALVTIQREVLTSEVVDYRGIAVVLDGPLRIGGFVTSAASDGDVIVVTIRSGAELDEGVIKRLVIHGTPPAEIVWSVGRLGGFDRSQIVSPDLRLVADRFHVAMPIRAWALGDGLRLDEVDFTTDRPRIEAALSFEKGRDVMDEFLAAEAWAIARVDADSLLDAEQAGVAMIESALDRVALEAQYSLSRTPTGELPAFARTDLFADPRAERLALVRGVATPRAWLRSLEGGAHEPAVVRRRVQVGGPPIGHNPRFDEAVRAWRRSVQSTEPIAAVSGLWEAIEFYAARARPPQPFSQQDKAAIRTAIQSAGLSEEQERRLSDILAAANDQPLLTRLTHALVLDGVPYTDAEIAVMRRLRDVRNDFVHGRSRQVPSRHDLAVGRGFVNRLLVYWAQSPRLRE